ncbi:MAG: hypothetical protein JWS10_3112 [Cypionkella sp.]|nr:hypothetical protein [Cypionkella sp.]
MSYNVLTTFSYFGCRANAAVNFGLKLTAAIARMSARAPPARLVLHAPKVTQNKE